MSVRASNLKRGRPIALGGTADRDHHLSGVSLRPDGTHRQANDRPMTGWWLKSPAGGHSPGGGCRLRATFTLTKPT